MTRNLAKSFVILAISMGAIGCNVPGAHVLMLDSEFSAEEIGTIQLAIDEWYGASDCSDDATIFTKDGFDYNRPFTAYQWGYSFEYPVLFRAQTSDAGTAVLDNTVDEGSEVLGYASNDGNVMLVVDRLDETTNLDKLHAVALHEIGHFLSLGHLSHGIMYSSYDDTVHDCIDQFTIDNFCHAVKSCGAKYHSTCK